MVHFFRKKILYNLTVSYFWNWINYYQIQQFVYKNFLLLSNILVFRRGIKWNGPFLTQNWANTDQICILSFNINRRWFFLIFPISSRIELTRFLPGTLELLYRSTIWTFSKSNVTSYFFYIIEIKITGKDSNQSRNVWLKLLFFSFLNP